jgi:hypothetical protein
MKSMLPGRRQAPAELSKTVPSATFSMLCSSMEKHPKLVRRCIDFLDPLQGGTAAAGARQVERETR